MAAAHHVVASSIHFAGTKQASQALLMCKIAIEIHYMHGNVLLCL